MELNAEQIKKALECCKTPLASDCENCSYTGKRLEDGVYEGCVNCLVGDALALVNSQEQRIKELTEELQKLKKVKYIFSTVDYCADDLAKALEENKKLTEENERLRNSSVDYRNIPEIKEKERADTVREMHSKIKERCIKGGIYPAFVESTIDQIAKEMLEGEK